VLVNDSLLKVLLVEDSDRDAALLTRHLTKCGYELDSLRVENDEDFTRALRSREWDVILSDYSLPAFNALSALFLLTASELDIPFIIISGTIGEDVAVEAMRLGASDYLMKDNLARLGPAIERELEEARNRRAKRTAEDSVHASEQRYRLLFESNPIPMWVYDLETLRFLEVNDAAVSHYGYTRDEFASMKITDIRSTEHAEELLKEIKLIDSPLSATKVWKHRKADGREIAVEVTAHSIDFNGRAARLVLSNDVSERQSLELQLRQSQKMEAIGVLAGGIAHDFNNLLTVINGYSDLLLRTVASDSAFWSNIRDIREAGERAASLTRQLLAFSRKQVLEPRVLDMNLVVADLEKMLSRIIGENIDFRTITDEDLCNISADPGQVEQIVMNLVVNARDAMPGGGKLTIETHNVDLTEEYARRHIAVNPGKYVMLAVTDTGFGMDEVTKQRIFEPFFSTKEIGHGTGLGLSMVYGIVKQSGGNIWVYSEPGRGTTFKVYLPAVDAEVSVAPNHVDQPVLSGTETVLLVEDEDLVRKLAKDVLELFGYRVLTASGGPEALALCEEVDGKIDLLLTDVVMPEMSGRVLADLMLERFPHIAVLFMSGYTDNAIVHQGVIDADAHFVQKPFQTDALVRKVREVLDSSERGR